MTHKTLQPNTAEIAGSSLTDSHTIKSLRSLLSADMPDGVTQTDLLQIIYMVLHKGEDHALTVSQRTLARRCRADLRTLQRSQDRLEEMGWIARSRRRGRTSDLSLVRDRLPRCESEYDPTPTAKAGDLAVKYQLAIKRRGLKKRFPRPWLGHQRYGAQQWINACDGDAPKALELIEHALDTPRFQKRAADSLYHLFGSLKKIQDSFAASSSVSPPIVSDAPPSDARPYSAEAVATAERIRRFIGLAKPSPVWCSVAQQILDRGHTQADVLGAAEFMTNKPGGLETLRDHDPNLFIDYCDNYLKRKGGPQ